MKIKDYSFSKTISKTHAYRENGLTNYKKVEASETRTIENPDGRDIEELKREVHQSVSNACSFDPEWIGEGLKDEEIRPKREGVAESQSKVKKRV